MSLQIQQQDSLFVENQSRNGQVQQVHYVVKNTPFHIKLSVAGASSLNFNTSLLSCTLCYDLPDRKEVEGVKGLPVDYLMHPSADGRSSSVQVRIRVLSTQHHGSHFIIRFRLTEKGVSCETNSQPIKTTSKLDPIRRKIAESNLSSGGKDQTVAPAEPKTTKTKRARSDQLLESLDEIKETQREQNQMLSTLFYNIQTMTNSTAQNLYSPTPKATGSISLESALERLLVAYNSIDPNERPYKLRHVVSSIAEKEYQEMLYEVGSVLSTPLSSPSIGPIVCSSPTLDCSSPIIYNGSHTPTSDSTSAEDRSPPADLAIPLVEPSLYLKELELWNSALHDILTQEDEI